VFESTPKVVTIISSTYLDQLVLTSLSLIIAIICYLLATALVIRFVRSKPHSDMTNSNMSASATPSVLSSSTPSIKTAFTIGIIAALAHALYASQTSIVDGQLDLGLRSMMVLISCILVGLYILGGLLMPIKRLGILVFPITLLGLAFSGLWPSSVAAQNQANQAFNSHILVSILAFAVLAIAAIQAVLYAYQEQQIKQRTNPAMLMALPPLQTMEQLLFRLIGVGFLLLSLTLVSGALFSQEIFGHAFEFKHHTILAIMGWLVFAILLFKRATTGIRGSQAVIWTIGGFVLIKLGYFGTKIVTEGLALV